jgi:putative alpha-1,2-mannosidase
MNGDKRVYCLVLVCAAVVSASLVDLVDTRIGGGGAGYGDGGINPGPQVPFGAMRLGPDTTWAPLGGDTQVNHAVGLFFSSFFEGTI